MDCFSFCLPLFDKNGVRGLLERYSELGRNKLLAIYKMSAKIDHTMLVLWQETSKKTCFLRFLGRSFFLHGILITWDFVLHGRARPPCNKNPSVKGHHSTPPHPKKTEEEENKTRRKNCSETFSLKFSTSWWALSQKMCSFAWVYVDFSATTTSFASAL